VPAGAPSDPRPFDAIVRPTKPHIVTDRGFGHAGYPAMSMSAQGAEAFCVWLSGVTGRRYRLPTESEWAAACLAGGPGPWSCGAEPDCLDGCAWFRENADRKTHPVGSKAPNALGLHDLHGNVAEWCRNAGGGHVLKGGSFRDRAIELRADAGQQPSPAWNQSDPNLPRSVWWLADAPFAGFRVVCEDGPDR
jgi:formylglycine-generating enzyme required for sulfatase activity